MDLPGLKVTFAPAHDERKGDLRADIEHLLRELGISSEWTPDREDRVYLFLPPARQLNSRVDLFSGSIFIWPKEGYTSGPTIVPGGVTLGTVPYISPEDIASSLEMAQKALTLLGPGLGTALGAWLHARYGRKVRIKVGDIEVEARTLEEVKKALKEAREIQQRNEPKKIHEP